MRDVGTTKELQRLGREFKALETDLVLVDDRREELEAQLDDPARAEYRDWTKAKLNRLAEKEKRIRARVEAIGDRVDQLRGVDLSIPRRGDGPGTAAKRRRLAEVFDEVATIETLQRKSPSPLLHEARERRLVELHGEAEILRREIEVAEKADRVKAADRAQTRMVN